MEDFTEAYVKYRREKAYESLDDAWLLLNNERWNTAVNRMYYSAFFIISALLVKNKLKASSHQGVRVQFSKHFIKTNRIDEQYGRLFAQLSAMRQKGDYGDLVDIDKDDAWELFPKVKELIHFLNAFIESS